MTRTLGGVVCMVVVCACGETGSSQDAGEDAGLVDAGHNVPEGSTCSADSDCAVGTCACLGQFGSGPDDCISKACATTCNPAAPTNTCPKSFCLMNVSGLIVLGPKTVYGGVCEIAATPKAVGASCSAPFDCGDGMSCDAYGLDDSAMGCVTACHPSAGDAPCGAGRICNTNPNWQNNYSIAPFDFGVCVTPVPTGQTCKVPGAPCSRTDACVLPMPSATSASCARRCTSAGDCTGAQQCTPVSGANFSVCI